MGVDKKIFIVVSAQDSTTKAGKPYTKLVLKELDVEANQPKGNELGGFIWERACGSELTSEHRTVLLTPTSFNFKKSFKGDLDDIHIAEYDVKFVEAISVVPKGQYYDEYESMREEIDRLINNMDSDVVKNVAKSLINLYDSDDFKDAPAAKGVHHAFRGGLIEHIYEMVSMAHALLQKSWFADLNKDLCYFGIIFHDIGKISEYKVGANEITRPGMKQLVPHIPLCGAQIYHVCQKLNVPDDIMFHLMHVVLAHHGKVEWGSPVAPMTPEAHFVHHIDNMHGSVRGILQSIENDNTNADTVKSTLGITIKERFSDVLKKHETTKEEEFQF